MAPWDGRLLASASARQIEVVELQREAGRAFQEAAELIEAVADDPDGSLRIRTVAALHRQSDCDERSAAWSWVLLLLPVSDMRDPIADSP